jgi:hypothetical protein
MSTLQVANIHFDALGDNKIIYEANTIQFTQGSQTAISTGRIANTIATISVLPKLIDDPIGSLRISFDNTAPNGYIEVTSSAILISSYPELGALLSTNATHFQTPPFNGNFSPYNNGLGQNTYIYMKT